MKKRSFAGIIQARMGSTRLRSKSLLELPYASGVTLLEQVISRSQKASGLDIVLVATSANPADDAIADLCKRLGAEVFRGSEENVLERFFLCAAEYGAEHVVRLCGDNPFIDCALIDGYVKVHTDHENDYTGTVGYPLGTNTEIVSFETLETAFEKASSKNDIEHVTPFIRRNEHNTFKLEYPEADAALKRPDIRLTVDTEEDYALACSVYDYLYSVNPAFPLQDVIALFENKPWLAFVNRMVEQKKPLATLDEELDELARIAKKQDLLRAFEYLAERKQSQLGR